MTIDHIDLVFLNDSLRKHIHCLSEWKTVDSEELLAGFRDPTYCLPFMRTLASNGSQHWMLRDFWYTPRKPGHWSTSSS